MFKGVPAAGSFRRMHPHEGNEALLEGLAGGPSGVRDPDAVVSARGLTKRFGAFTAVDAVNFSIRRGEVFGFLGPNGAGKTSTMRMVSCLSPVTEGSLQVLGMDPNHDGPQIRRRLGLVPQEDTLDLELQVRDNLYLYGRYFDLPKRDVRARVERLLEFAQLVEKGDEEVDTLSGGMKRRLTIARALISDPDRDPRRADDRARSSGASPAVGSPVPAEATGREPRHHDSLHGRGRAALRPPRRDGQRTDRCSRIAEGADRSVLHERGRRAALRRRRAREDGRSSRPPCQPVRDPSRTPCSSTPTTAMPFSTLFTSSGSGPRRRSSGDRASRTSSCG